MSVQTRKLIGRSMLILVALTMIGAMVAACAPAAPAPAAQPTAAPAAAATAAPAAATEKVQLRFVVMDYDEKMRPDTQALVDEFNASQNEIEVKLDVLGWGEGHDTLLTQISGGQAPDLANGNAQWVGEWSGINEVAPLDDLLSKEFLANFVPAGLQAFTIDGKLMAMPYFLDPRALYYRKDLFEKAGLKAPETWDDVFAAAEKLNSPEMNAFGLAFSRASDDMDYWWYAWLGANGADGNTKLWDENGKSRFNTPEGIAATQFLVDLAQKYKAVNPDFVTAGRDQTLQPLFYNSKLAMLETGSWYPTLLKNNAPDLQVGIAAIPVAKAGMKHVTAFWPDAIMMFKQTKHPKEAAKFLEWMYGKENRLLFAKQRGVIPERIDVGADPAYAVGDTEKFFVEQLQTARNAYETPFPATIYKVYTEAENLVARAVAGEITAEEAMKQAAEFADKTNGK
jgi:multiple sugar transport system substrate-binding protein